MLIKSQDVLVEAGDAEAGRWRAGLRGRAMGAVGIRRVE